MLLHSVHPSADCTISNLLLISGAFRFGNASGSHAPFKSDAVALVEASYDVAGQQGRVAPTDYA